MPPDKNTDSSNQYDLNQSLMPSNARVMGGKPFGPMESKMVLNFGRMYVMTIIATTTPMVKTMHG